jgi:hypothetical protein
MDTYPQGTAMVRDLLTHVDKIVHGTKTTVSALADTRANRKNKTALQREVEKLNSAIDTLASLQDYFEIKFQEEEHQSMQAHMSEAAELCNMFRNQPYRSLPALTRSRTTYHGRRIPPFPRRVIEEEEEEGESDDHSWWGSDADRDDEETVCDDRNHGASTIPVVQSPVVPAENRGGVLCQLARRVGSSLRRARSVGSSRPCVTETTTAQTGGQRVA